VCSSTITLMTSRSPRRILARRRVAVHRNIVPPDRLPGVHHNGGVRLGVVVLPTDPWPQTRALARHLDDLGYDHVWTYDHLSWRHYRERVWQAAIPWLTGIAASTTRIRVGPLVSSPNFRHPVNLAKEAMTLDHVSEGRLILGVGAGGVGWDSTVLGDPTLGPSQLASRLDEFVTVLDRLLREPAVSHRGQYYTVDDARMVPGCVQQPRVPLAIAAAGPRTLAVVARSADAWITHAGAVSAPGSPGDLDTAVRAQTEALARTCDGIGRDPGTIDRIYMIGFEQERPLTNVAQFQDFMARFDALGFTDLVFHAPRRDDPTRDDPEEIIEQIAAELLRPRQERPRTS
jgi:alkanesulfonate monooxygenase SsuD/methylene tetrahydromethanopterin reductase-like flavin-dependent oxidoreductase (luciferase family)